MENKKELINLLLLILIAYAFSLGFRFVYIEEVKNISSFFWQNQLMINNPDGYYYAEGARDILTGHQSNYLSPVNAPLSILTAYFVKFFHIPLDSAILYMPGIFGSLIVIPLILIGRALKNIWIGFLAALLSGIAWSYYHRTMFGYYDTDMLTVVLPTFAIWAVIESLIRENKNYYLVAAFFEILMIYWHGGLYNVANGVFIMSFIYILYVYFIKKEDIRNKLIFLFFILIPLIKISFIIQILILLFLYFSEKFIKEKKFQLIYLFVGVGIIYLAVIGIPWINNVLHNSYFTKNSVNAVDNIKYFDVVNTVREAGKINYNVLIHRISGSWVGFLLGAAGYLLLILRCPVAVVFLPMMVLGLFAVKGGLRFTVFAVPFFALGNAYLFWFVANYLSKFFINEAVAKYFKYIFSFVCMGFTIYPNIIHDKHYLTPVVVNKNEVEVLKKLSRIANEKDYAVTWWDYGYAIRYYAKIKTLIDGGKHSGDVNFPVSYALTRPQIGAYNASILAVYLTEKDRIENKKYDFVKQVMQMYKLKNPNEVYPFLLKSLKLPKIKENIYYYLPYRMLNIFPTVAIFSSIDLKNGKVFNHFFYSSNTFIRQKNTLVLGKDIRVLLDKGLIKIGNNLLPIKNFVLVALDRQGKTVKKIQQISTKGINIIVMQSYKKILLLDDFYYNSSYIQMFVLGNVNEKLFKPVIVTPLVKVYKIIK